MYKNDIKSLNQQVNIPKKKKITNKKHYMLVFDIISN